MKKNNTLSLLAACFAATLLLASCERIDYDKDAKAQPRFWLKIFVENPSKPAESPSRASVQQEPETFTFNIGEDNDCEMTCVVTDMEGGTPVSPTRGMPVGTTVGLTINGTTFAVPQSNPITTAYGDGISITAYQKDNKGSAPTILTPNSKKPNGVAATENAASVPYFQNLTFTWDGTMFNNEGSWVTASNIGGYYWHDTDSLSFFTYAPTGLGATYNAATRKGTFSYTNPTANASQKDILIGATPFAPQPPIDENAGADDPSYEINVSTFHALCAVRFVVDNTTKGTAPNYTQRSKDFKINSITLTNLKTGGTCTYTYSADPTKHSSDCVAWSSLTGTADYSCTYNKTIAKTNDGYNLHSSNGTASGTQEGTSFLLIPQELAENCKVTINFTRSDRTKTITGQLVGAGATKDTGGNYTSYGSWLPGKMYTYVIESKNINPWKVGETEELLGEQQFDSTGKSAKAQDVGSSLDITDIKVVSLSWWQVLKGFKKITDSGADGAMSLWITGKDKDGNELSTLGQSISFNGSTWAGAYMGYDPSASTHPDPALGSATAPLIYYFDVSNYVELQVVLSYCNNSGGGSSSWWQIHNLTMTVEELLPG